MIGHRCLFLSLLVFSQLSFADILFIDLNDAPQEIKAAREAASARGENLIVIPSEASRKQISREQITAEFRKFQSSGQKFNSIVLSGHDGNGGFSGSRGDQSFSIDVEDLQSEFKKTPAVFQDVRSVLLWGCRTTNIGSLDVYWKDSGLPNVKVFAGFDDSGPSKYRQANADYLKDFLRLDQQIAEAPTKSKVEELVNQIRGFRVTNSSICSKQFMVTQVQGKAKAMNIQELRKECDTKSNEVASGRKAFQCYYEARDRGCQNPPQSGQSHNELVDFYNVIRAKSVCRAYWDDLVANGDESAVIPELLQLEKLIHFDEIKTNLTKLHADDLRAADGLLRGLSAPADLTLSNLGELSREQIVRRLAKLNEFLSRYKSKGTADDYMKNTKAADIYRLKMLAIELRGLVSDFNTTPDSWTGSNQAEPSAMLKFQMSNQGKKRADDVVTVARFDRSLREKSAVLDQTIKEDPNHPLYSDREKLAKLADSRFKTQNLSEGLELTKKWAAAQKVYQAKLNTSLATDLYNNSEPSMKPLLAKCIDRVKSGGECSLF